jgi:four helix bundle protein
LQGKIEAEFFAKLSITVEEADEVIFWVEILRESSILNDENVQNFEREGREILAVLTTARKNTR